MILKNKKIHIAVVILLVFLGGTALFFLTSENTVKKSCPYEDALPVREDARPNIIVFMTDDQPPDTLNYMPIVQEELMEQGVTFTNGFVTTPLCCPSRASILTGQYAHNHNVWVNRLPNGGAAKMNDGETIAVWLQEAGYSTANIGKYLNGYGELEPAGVVPLGWDEWYVFYDGNSPKRYFFNYVMSENGDLVEYGDADADYGTDVIADKAFDFIINSADAPFFMILGFYAPHQPRTPAPRHYDMFRTDEEVSARRPLNFQEEDISDKPNWLSLIAREDDERHNKVYQQALRSLQSVDEAVGLTLDGLDCIGQRENTMIIFMSDNGITWGEHGIPNGKNCPYEECIRVPFVVYYPAGGSGGREDERFILNIDLAPTFAALAGIEIDQPVDGVNFLPLLDSAETSEWRDIILIEHWPTKEGDGSLIPEFYGVRTNEWKYVEYVTGEKELYNLIDDPYEMENLIESTAYQSIVLELQRQLHELMDK